MPVSLEQLRAEVLDNNPFKHIRARMMFEAYASGNPVTSIPKTAGLATGAVLAHKPLTTFASTGSAGMPALLGGKKAHTGDWPIWTRWIPEQDEVEFIKTVRSGVWSRANTVTEFERRWAKAIGAKRCLAVVNGTNALITAVAQRDIGAGDEVILPPYTFIATPQSILMNGAIPVFCDIDPATYQLDPKQIEAKITPRTRAIMPVHIFGLPADMTAIMAIAKKHNLLVVEDACQAWLAEINGKKCGTFGNAGCHSFQNSKNMSIGEGGAIVSDDEAFMDRCYSYHNYGNPYGTAIGSVGTGTLMLGTKLRYTEYQSAMGLAQLKRLRRPNWSDYCLNAAPFFSILRESFAIERTREASVVDGIQNS